MKSRSLQLFTVFIMTLGGILPVVDGQPPPYPVADFSMRLYSNSTVNMIVGSQKEKVNLLTSLDEIDFTALIGPNCKACYKKKTDAGTPNYNASQSK